MYKGLKEIKCNLKMDKSRFENARYNKDLYLKALEQALNITKSNIEVFTDRFPHVGENNVYPKEENKLWTASFFPGIAHLAYEVSKDDYFLSHFEDYYKSFKWRLEEGNTVTHDIGFLYTLTCVANYKITGNEKAKELAIKAADKLITRYNENGRYIQAWKEIGAKVPDVKIIIDTMLNLPLLYWATEVTGDKKYYEIAYNHAITASQYLIRDDASSFHTYLMDPDSGEALEGKTHQGRFDSSTWARGQAWAVYGFILSYMYTKEPYFLQVAKETANYFINNLPKDFVPYWDFTFNDMDRDIRDSSAGSIFVCGLLELAKYLKGEEQSFYLNVTYKVMESLYENYSVRENSNGLILHGMYHRLGGEECTIWGDYYYLEALVRLTSDWKPYW